MNQKILITILFLTAAISMVGFNTANAASNTVLDFDGTSDYLVADDNSVFDQADRLSISVWIQPDDTPGVDEYIVYRFNDYYLKMDSSRKIIASVHTDAETVTSTSAITCDGVEWTHIEMTYDKDAGGTDEIKIYINSVLDAVGDYSTSNAVSAELLYIGAADLDGVGVGVAVTNWFDGKIDDVRLYQYARSPSDVRLDYNDGLAVRLGGRGVLQYAPTEDCSLDPASCMDLGLVGHWNMDEAGGDTLYDQSDNGNDGTLGSGVGADSADPKWISGSQTSGASGSLTSGGGALQFDGKDDYVDCGNDSSLNFGSSGDFSIETWIKTSNSGDRMCIVDKSYLSSTNGGYALQRHSSNKIWFEYFDGSSPSPMLAGTSDINDGLWHHIAIIWKADNTERKLYVDGVVEDETSSQSNSGMDSAYNLTIGRRANGSGFDFNGSIDGVKIYNRALSAEEVRYHYNRGGPVAHWKFDEGEGAKAYDESGNRNHGVLTNFGTSDTGTADAASTVTTLVDDPKAWTTNQWAGGTVSITSGTGDGQSRTVYSNTDDDIVVDTVWNPAPDGTSVYSVSQAPEWVAGSPTAPGSAILFDGKDDYINCGADSTLDITDAITIEAWVKPIVSDADIKQIIIRDWNINRIYIEDTNDLRTYNVIGGVHTAHIISNAFPIVDGSRWYHIVYSYESGDENFYIDGANKGHWTPIGVLSTKAAEPLLIGIYEDESSNPFNGSIDDVKIYNYARTAEQILVDYNNGLAAYLK